MSEGFFHLEFLLSPSDAKVLPQRSFVLLVPTGKRSLRDEGNTEKGAIDMQNEDASKWLLGNQRCREQTGGFPEDEDAWNLNHSKEFGFVDARSLVGRA